MAFLILHDIKIKINKAFKYLLYFNFYEQIWGGFFIVFTILGAFVAKSMFAFLFNPEYNDKAVASLSDLKIILPTTVLTWLLRDIFTHFAKNIVVKHIDHRTFTTEEERKDRSLVLCKWILDFFYYSFSTVMTYIILKDSNFLPPALFGHGDINLIKGQNFPSIELQPYLKELYCVQLGTHLHSFLHQVIMRRNDKKFFEYVLHHGVALLLILYSYCSNFINTGSIVLLTHDASDIMIVLARGYGDFSFKNKKMVNIIYFSAFSVWCYARLYAYPIYGIWSTYALIYVVEPKYKDIFVVVTAYMISMLCVLLVMHGYWTIFLLKAQFNSYFKNKVKVDYDVKDQKAMLKTLEQNIKK